jgi:hypothetical protein
MEQQSWQRVEVLQVLGGVIFGWLGGWFLFALATLVMYASYGDTGDQLAQVLVGTATLLVIPVVAGVVLIRRGRERLGSGLLLGVAIGSLVGAGVCTSAVLTGV